MKYKLVDNFCLFYLKFINDNVINDENFWQHSLNLPKLNSWRGLAFEEVCLSHTAQIKSALGIGSVLSNESSWSVKGDENQQGAQIDLVIDRNDKVVNLCEMKYVSQSFAVDKTYDLKLRERIGTAVANMPKRKNVQLTLVTTFGLAYNKYCGIFQNVVTIDDLFDK